MIEIMLDLETLSTDTSATIVQIGAVVFDRETGEIKKSFLVNVDPDSQEKYGFTKSKETLDWWDTQEKTWEKDPVDILVALEKFKDFIKGAKTCWSHATFDFPIIMEAYKRVGMKTPFNYKQARDIRTLNDLAGIKKADMPEAKEKKTHNALDDCLYQVEYCTVYFNKLKHE